MTDKATIVEPAEMQKPSLGTAGKPSYRWSTRLSHGDVNPKMVNRIIREFLIDWKKYLNVESEQNSPEFYDP